MMLVLSQTDTRTTKLKPITRWVDERLAKHMARSD